jgi:hypothetical protein
MFKKIALFLLLLILLTMTTTMQAQSKPTVEIVLDQRTAQQGDTVAADVYIRQVVNLGGADIAITVDPQCLTIVDRQPGNLLPTTGDKGGFSPFSELHDHDTRLATAVTDRKKIANGEGIFFQMKMKVTCAQGTAQIKVSFAQLASYKDPVAKDIELISYKLDQGNINTIDAQLSIGPKGQVAAIPTQTLAPTETLAATPVPSITPTLKKVPTPVTTASPDNSILTVALVGMAGIIVVLGTAVVVLARRR